MIARLGQLCGPANVLTGAEAERYGRDWRGQYPSSPLAVVRPGSTGEVSDILRLASQWQIPVIPQGGNSGLVGGTKADGGLIVSLERMNRIRAIDASGRTAAVDAGVIVEHLNTRLAELELRFPLAFGAQGSAMIGGVLSTNAGGANVLAHGMTRALCLGLEVVMPDGRVLDDMVALRKNNTGYDLKQLFIGAEGTLGIITGAVLTLTDLPAGRATALLAVNGFDEGLAVLNRLRRVAGNAIEAFEVMPARYLAQLRRSSAPVVPPFASDPALAILVELASSAPDDCAPRADGGVPLVNCLTDVLGDCIEDGLIGDALVAQTEGQRAGFWRLREIAPELTIGLTPVVAADVSVPLDRIGDFAEALDTALGEADADAPHWTVGHLGDGNLHVVVCPADKSPAHLGRIRAVIDDVTMRHAGSFSAEHGIGLQKLASMSRHKDPLALELMRRIKDALDPLGIMNPGKVVPL
ncbi:hypothetical protein AWJ14_12485 [Hoeflea olei]|uniref:FAD-binding PCMH-type domain-containing protein n=2 Tax=Hoeflea olei TaxID=1480615 RepID=A0A1C1YRS7_9HYPH|nr:hypothetical protein AWJ14_12485 [Hoeflea olei]